MGKKPKNGKRKPLDLIDRAGTVEKIRKHKGDASKNTYWIKNKYGTHVVHGTKLKFKTKV